MTRGGYELGEHSEEEFLELRLSHHRNPGEAVDLQLSDGRQIDVTVPAGTQDCEVLRLKGQGLAGIGGATAGDALVEISVTPHAALTRKDSDIHVDLPVTLPEAVLGGIVQVPTVDGRVSLRIPAGSNTGSTLRLKGKGVPDRSGGPRGDQYVTLKIVLPDQPDDALKTFVSGWSPAEPYAPRRKAGLE